MQQSKFGLPVIATGSTRNVTTWAKAASKETQLVTSCHEAVTCDDIYGKFVIANTTDTDIGATSHTGFPSITANVSSDNMYKTPSEAETCNRIM